MIGKALLKSVVDAASSLLENPQIPEVADPFERDEEADLREAELASLRERVRTVDRINSEYFEVIETIERERDRWKAMLFEQSSEHQNAQALLQKALSDCSHHLRSAIRQLDWFRRAADLEPIQTPAMLEKLPEAVPEAFGSKVQEMIASAGPQTNGLERRAEIATKLPKRRT
jgi:DNA repair ATPase RecN